MAELTNEEILKHIENMSVMDLANLVKELEDKFGVSAAAPVAVAAMPGVAAAAEEEQQEFDVIMTSFGDKKINVIKAVREVVEGLGLKEAKELVDNIPSKIKEAVTKEEAEELKKKFEEAGAQVDIK